MKEIIEQAIKSIQSVADANTVIGQPLTLPNGVTVVPYSKVSVGFAAGGTDRAPKNPPPDGHPVFAGGNGAGISVTPLGFLVISEDGSVQLLDLANPGNFAPEPGPVDKVINGVQSVIDRAPDLIAKCKTAFAKKEAAEETEETASEQTEQA